MDTLGYVLGGVYGALATVTALFCYVVMVKQFRSIKSNAIPPLLATSAGFCFLLPAYATLSLLVWAALALSQVSPFKKPGGLAYMALLLAITLASGTGAINGYGAWLGIAWGLSAVVGFFGWLWDSLRTGHPW